MKKINTFLCINTIILFLSICSTVYSLAPEALTIETHKAIKLKNSYQRILETNNIDNILQELDSLDGVECLLDINVLRKLKHLYDNDINHKLLLSYNYFLQIVDTYTIFSDRTKEAISHFDSLPKKEIKQAFINLVMFTFGSTEEDSVRNNLKENRYFRNRFWGIKDSTVSFIPPLDLDDVSSEDSECDIDLIKPIKEYFDDYAYNKLSKEMRAFIDSSKDFEIYVSDSLFHEKVFTDSSNAEAIYITETYIEQFKNKEVSDADILFSFLHTASKLELEKKQLYMEDLLVKQELAAFVRQESLLCLSINLRYLELIDDNSEKLFDFALKNAKGLNISIDNKNRNDIFVQISKHKIIEKIKKYNKYASTDSRIDLEDKATVKKIEDIIAEEFSILFSA